MRFVRWLAFLPLFSVAPDAPAATGREARTMDETVLHAEAKPPRTAHWADALAPIEIENLTTRERATVRLYAPDGAVDVAARDAFERVAAGKGAAHALAPRLEQLVAKAAYHFSEAGVAVVSAFRAHAGRHGTGDAIDFKLQGIRAARLAAYLRELPRVGVGIYTHPRTQFVHLDVRDASYYWLDASPPGVKWREAPLHVHDGPKRDGAWVPEMDLP